MNWIVSWLWIVSWIKSQSLIKWILAGIGAANFAWYLVDTFRFGGSTYNGKTDEYGHYFLENKGHYTEVSKEIYVYMRWHGFFFILMHMFVFIVGCLLAFEKKLYQLVQNPTDIGR